MTQVATAPDAPRIDAHVHFWRYSPADYGWIDGTMGAIRRDFLPEDLAPEAARIGFGGVIAVQARQDTRETDWLLELASHHSLIRGVVGWVDLQAAEARESLARVAANPLLVGVRHIVQDEPDDHFLLRPDFLRGIGLLAERDLAYDILVRPRHLPVARKFVQRFPGQRFVLDHLAKPDVRRGALGEWGRDLRALAACPNVMAKMSGLVTEADWSGWTAEEIRPCLEAAYDGFGPDRLMIGSDWPVCTLAGDYGRVLDVALGFVAGRPPAEQSAMLGGNAARFWRLPATSTFPQHEERMR